VIGRSRRARFVAAQKKIDANRRGMCFWSFFAHRTAPIAVISIKTSDEHHIYPIYLASKAIETRQVVGELECV
jgi:hypothetical protein